MTAHPENRRVVTEIRGPRHALVGVELVAAVGALACAFGLGGAALATALWIAIAATQLGGGLLLAQKHAIGRGVALAAALLAVAIGAVQIVASGAVAWPTLALIGGGALEALLVAACTPRGRSR